MFLFQPHRQSLTKAVLVGVCAVTLAACSAKTGGSATNSASTGKSVSSRPACAQSFSPAPDQMKMTFDKTETFGADNNAFTLTFPSQPWEVVDNGDFVTMLVNLKTFDARNVLTFGLVPTGGVVTLDQYAEGILNTAKTNANFNLVEDCIVEINGIPARKIIWTGDSGSFKNVKAVEYLMMKDGKALRIQFESGAEYYDKYVGSAEKIISSLQWK